MPNKKDVRNPKSEYMLSEFQYIVSGIIPLQGDLRAGFISELNPLQKDILYIMEVPVEYYSYEFLFNSG